MLRLLCAWALCHHSIYDVTGAPEPVSRNSAGIEQKEMAKPIRSIEKFVQCNCYTDTGRKSKQTQFQPEVVEYCFKKTETASVTRSAKVIIIGSPGVGKTSLLLRYCQNIFQKNYKTTIGVDFEVEKCTVLGHQLNLQLWDTAGAERFRGVTTNYFRGANAVVLVFDVSMASETLEKTRDWLVEVRANCISEFELFLVGAKKDLMSDSSFEREVEPLALEYAREYSAELWITSAMTGENVVEFFNRIAVITFENAIIREMGTLKQTEVAHAVAERSTIIRVQVNESQKRKRKGSSKCCS